MMLCNYSTQRWIWTKKKHNVLLPFICISVCDKSPINFSHSGYAWCISRKLYDEIGGVFQFEIVGSGDYKCCNAFINRDTLVYSDGHKQLLDDFKDKAKQMLESVI